MRLLFAAIALAACAPTATIATPKGGPRGLRATDHLDLAAQHDHLARDVAVWPEPTSGGLDSGGGPIALPWFRSWDTTSEHEHAAVVHRSLASALQAAYDEACGSTPLDEVSVSPLVRFGLGGWPTASGVIVYLSPSSGTPDQLLAALKCHRAFMMLAPADMDDCPLDLPGLAVDARGDTDGVTVSLTVKDPARVPELQRRTAHDLEAAHHRGAAAKLTHE